LTHEEAARRPLAVPLRAALDGRTQACEPVPRMTEPTPSEAARISELDAALRRLAHAALIAPDEREDVVQEAWVARLRHGTFALRASTAGCAQRCTTSRVTAAASA
jgi:DNA-directed RNA polymerase specialized sigma24 family protein